MAKTGKNIKYLMIFMGSLWFIRISQVTRVNNMAYSFDWMSKDEVISEIFNKYDTALTGELAPDQLQALHVDIRDGGISLAQVEASISEVCATDSCDKNELHDVLNEMDRRYFLVRDLQWEFNMLDRERKGTISERNARFLFQAVHDDFFSQKRWLKFLRSRAAPGSEISFAEIEVPLCNIPTLDWIEEEREEEEREKDELLRMKQKKEMEKVAERKKGEERAQFEQEAERRRQEAAKRKKVEEEARKRAEEEERKYRLQKEEEAKDLLKREDEAKKLLEEEERRLEEERLRREEDGKRKQEEEEKRREEEEAQQKWKKEELLKQQQLEREKEEKGKT